MARILGAQFLAEALVAYCRGHGLTADDLFDVCELVLRHQEGNEGDHARNRERQEASENAGMDLDQVATDDRAGHGAQTSDAEAQA